LQLQLKQLSSVRFRPGLIPTLATLVMFPILIALGFWQLDRAEQKEQAAVAFEARLEQPALDLNRQIPDPRGDLFRLAEARGGYDPERQLLLDNQTHNRQVGYNVLTPFVLDAIQSGDDRGTAVLVDRGWVQGGRSRSELPAVPLEQGITSVRGHLDQGPATGIRLGGMDDGEAGWPLRVQYLDFEALEQRLGYALLPVVLRLDQAEPGGYVRQWRPKQPEGYGPERNRGYALQWFGLAATLAVIYLVVNLTWRRKDTDAKP